MSEALYTFITVHPWSVAELLLIVFALGVLAWLAVDFTSDMVEEVRCWRARIKGEGTTNAIDSARVHRETSRAVERLAGRVSAPKLAASVAGVATTRSATGCAVVGASASGVETARQALDRNSEYGLTTTLVGTEPWITGRDS